MRRLLPLALLICHLPLAWAERQVDVPLAIDLPHLRGQVALALGLETDGTGELKADLCNRLELSQLALASVDGELRVALDLTGHTGADAFGRCRGPRPWVGQLQLRLNPRLDSSGKVILFDPSGAELRRTDGSRGLLTRPTRLLADTLLVPRMEEVRVDIGEALSSIDGLIELFLGQTTEGTSALAQRGHLTSVAVANDGLQAELRFALNAPSPEMANETDTTATQAAADAEQSADADGESEAALDDSELAQWQRVEDELDGFLTVIIARLAGQAESRDLQLDLLGALIDTRTRIAEALVADQQGEDPVRRLFLDAWTQLKPLLSNLAALNVGDDSGLRLAGFMAAGDALQLVDELGPEYGLEISRDGLRRLARLLLADEAPASFTPLPLEPDAELRRLFGFQQPQPSAPPQSLWQRLTPIPKAYANELSPAEALRNMVPQLDIIDSYLEVVARLLNQALTKHLDGSRLSENQRQLFDPLVRATAWKETCWRHYIERQDELQVIRSAVGAVGMMQILGRVWRSVYDIERLEEDVAYNVTAGIEILEHYFLDYAVRREEHKQPGGMDNLVKATYAAYNGGPSQLSRYRREDTAARAKAIDREFFRHYRSMKSAPWPAVSSCYAV